MLPARLRPPLAPAALRPVLLAFAAVVLTCAGCATVGSDGDPHAGGQFLPDAKQIEGFPVWGQVAAIVVGTLVSEDAACIFVGVEIRKGHLEPWVGGLACFLGIYVGDLLFFFLGRLGGKRLLRFRVFSHGFGPDRLAAFGAWFDRRPWAAIAMCRVMPGIRVPLYLAVGALTKRTATFFAWTCFFAFVWTPALIALVVLLGEAFTEPFERLTGARDWRSTVLGVLTLYLLIRTATLVSTAQGREKLAGRFGFLWGRQRKPADNDPLLTGNEVPPARRAAGEAGGGG